MPEESKNKTFIIESGDCVSIERRVNDLSEWYTVIMWNFATIKDDLRVTALMVKTEKIEALARRQMLMRGVVAVPQ